MGTEPYVYLTNFGDYVRTKESGLWLTERMTMALTAGLKYYRRCYVPTGGLVGATVLDIGAEVGSTAWFFFQHGAKKVIAIEPEECHLEKLRFNKHAFRWNMDIIPRKFELSDLDIPRDFTKMNIEGFETDLLVPQPVPKEKLGRMTVTAHNEWIAQRFKKMGFRDLTNPDPMLGMRIMGNW